MAMWFVLEQYELSKKQKQNINMEGYLYQFETTKDLPIHVIDDIRMNPKPLFRRMFKGFLDFSTCRNKICVHPQIVYRGNPRIEYEAYQISLEVTMNLTNKRYRDSMDLTTIYPIDISERFTLGFSKCT
jgi:hypothetical protein